MKGSLRFDKNMRFIGENAKGQQTFFDTTAEGGDGSAATPMEILLQSAAACTAIDVISILRKKRKTVEDLRIELDSTRSEAHPKVFTSVHMKVILKSPDAELKDLERSIALSHENYCSVSAVLKNSGAKVTSEAILER